MTETPVVGMGAIEVLYSDTVAYVITRVSDSGTRIWVKRVEIDESPENRRVTNPGEPYPCTINEGILDKPYGDERMVTLNKHGRWMRKGSRFVLGKSYRMVDYRI